jgi:glycosyltransferase involved in cell wall biosynthesis
VPSMPEPSRSTSSPTSGGPSPARAPHTLEVVFPQGQDPEDWARRHAAGLVPSRWPYGLDGLGGGVVPVTHTQAPASTRPARLRREVAARWPRAGAGHRTGRAGHSVLTWDENTYGRVAPLPRGVRSHSGVIWLTDADRTSSAVRQRSALLRRADGLWCMSDAQVGPLVELLGAGGPSVHYVPFGVDHEFFTAAPYPERPLVVSIGGDRDRDTATLFEALRGVLRAVPDAEVVVQAKTTLTPPDGVRLVPRFTHVELRDLYRRMSVMLIATRHNLHVSGMTVSLESMATARPVVITGTPGMAEYVRDGETGAVVDGTAALVEATVELLRAPGTADDWGRRGRRLVEESFTTAHLCRRLDAVVAAGR